MSKESKEQRETQTKGGACAEMIQRCFKYAVQSAPKVKDAKRGERDER